MLCYQLQVRSVNSVPMNKTNTPNDKSTQLQRSIVTTLFSSSEGWGMDTTLFVTSDLSVGSVDGECLGVLVARGDDGPPQMEGASRRSLLPFLRLHDKR
jgi:hypothetical protein